MPKVSVIMPVKNGMPFISEAIDSVLNQTFTDFELIVRDDGSVDETVACVSGYTDPRIKLLRHASKGIAKGLNEAIATAKGDFIAILDADDRWAPEKLETQYNFLASNPEYVLVGTSCNIIDEEGNYLYTHIKPEKDEELRALMDVYNTWTHSSILYSRKAYDAVGGYYEPITNAFEDYILNYQLTLHGKVYQFTQPLVDYRIVSTADSAKHNSSEFKAIMQRTVKQGFATEEDQKRVAEINRQQNKSPRYKLSLYHLFLGRSYMFHNYNRKKSITHLRKSVALRPALKVAWIYLAMVLFLPKGILKRIYGARGQNTTVVLPNGR